MRRRMLSQCGCHLLTNSVVTALNIWCKVEEACRRQPADVEVVLSDSMEDPALAQLNQLRLRILCTGREVASL